MSEGRIHSPGKSWRTWPLSTPSETTACSRRPGVGAAAGTHGPCPRLAAHRPVHDLNMLRDCVAPQRANHHLAGLLRRSRADANRTVARRELSPSARRLSQLTARHPIPAPQQGTSVPSTGSANGLTARTSTPLGVPPHLATSDHPQNRSKCKMTADQSVAIGDRSRLARRSESVVSDRHTLHLKLPPSQREARSTTARGTIATCDERTPEHQVDEDRGHRPDLHPPDGLSPPAP